MHVKRLKQLAEWLEKGGRSEHLKFNMWTMALYHYKGGWAESTWSGPENLAYTEACIGGLAVQSWGTVESVEKYGYHHTAQTVLGLDRDQAYELFYPEDYAITSKDAAKVLRHLIETGTVDWSITGFAED